MLKLANEDLQSLLVSLCELLESRLETALEEANLSSPLTEAVHHAVFPGGKRIRPLFALLLCSDLGGNPRKMVDVATSLEMIHCATLVHDDLPALDDDDIRRGSPSCHKAYGEATAVLVGDFLSSYATYFLSTAQIADFKKLALMRGLSKAYADIAHGQQLDLLGTAPIAQVHRLKTGVLFELGAYFGAVGADCDVSLGEQIRALGMNFGMFFQSVDDFLDVHGTLEEQGRPTGSDRRNDRSTAFSEGERVGLESLRLSRERLATSLDRVEREARRGPMVGVRSILETLDQRLTQSSRKG